MEPTKPSGKWMRGCGCLVAFGVFFVFAIGAGFVFPFHFVFLMLFGWIGFIIRTLPHVELNLDAIAIGVLSLVGTTLLTHIFMKKIYADIQSQQETNLTTLKAWQVRWSLQAVGVMVLLFVVTMAATGITHQIGFLLTTPEEWIVSGYEGRAKEGSVKSNMHTVQSAVEDYAAKHEGNYPAHDHPGFLNLSEMLDVSLMNRFQHEAPALVPGIPYQTGQVGYEHADYDSSSYRIYGYGTDSLFLDGYGNTFVLTNER